MSFTKSVVLFTRLLSPIQPCVLSKPVYITSFHRRTNPQYTNRRCLSSSFPKEKFQQQSIITKNELLEFDKVFPDIINDIVNDEKFENVKEVASRFERSLKYNVPRGKKNRGLAVVASYKILEKSENLTTENLKLAAILGWTVEMLQAFLLVMDDFVDGSETRRGQLCWYKLENIGCTAINDGLLLENAIFLLLRKYFSNHPSYVQFIELFHDVTVMTTVGQILDGNIQNVNTFTMERFDQIAHFKTTHYTFYLPVCLALYFTNHLNPVLHKNVKKILYEIGKLFQIQDDFIDCFGDPKMSGKIGSDIETGKCTWLAVKAMELASASQKSIMEGNYGKNDAKSVKRVKDLYRELDIPELCSQYEGESYKRIQSNVEQLSDEVPREIFDKLSAAICKRVR